MLDTKLTKKSTVVWNPPPRPVPPPDLIKLSPMTKDEWAKLDGKARWDSIVTLRGPDRKHSITLKHITTSIIRYRLSEVMRVGGQVNNSLPFCILPIEHASAPADSFDWDHFIPHIAEACEWLGIQYCYVDGPAWFATINKGGWSPLKDLRSYLTGPYLSTANWILQFQPSQEPL